jgi:membrane protease YdiL (CAAX protease family)
MKNPLLKIILFVAIGLTVYEVLPPLLWSMLPDLGPFRGAAKGSMATVIILSILSWYFLKSDKKTFATIGLEARGKRLLQLIAGVAAGVLMNALISFSLSLFFDFQWQLNKDYNISIILFGLVLNIWSASAEELIYRGYAFEKSVDIYGSGKSMAGFIFLFAFIHIFAWGAWGDPGKMLSVLVTTGLGGLLFSLAFLRTRSLALPIGLHTGFIWANADFFTGMFARWYNNKQGLFVAVNTEHYFAVTKNGWLLSNLSYIGVSLIAVFLVYSMKKKNKVLQ